MFLPKTSTCPRSHKTHMSDLCIACTHVRVRQKLDRSPVLPVFISVTVQDVGRAVLGLQRPRGTRAGQLLRHRAVTSRRVAGNGSSVGAAAHRGALTMLNMTCMSANNLQEVYRYWTLPIWWNTMCILHTSYIGCRCSSSTTATTATRTTSPPPPATYTRQGTAELQPFCWGAREEPG